MSLKKAWRTGAAVFVIGAVLAATGASPASATDDIITQGLGTGDLSATVNGTFPGAIYSTAAQDSLADLTLAAADNRGTRAGWTVSVLSSDFVYSGADGTGTDIPVSAFSIVSMTQGEVTKVTGQVVNATAATGPNVGTTLGTLGLARTVLVATAAYGDGSYTVPLHAKLVLPAQARVGTYTATLTVTIVT